ncbi:GNAT family N-acetyltransferase [Pseudaeromonas sp. ZJS20]|uniref:acyl-homoserine-lactone synthase n=1 Tax=Pseudaeromonas aegiceratis TaxID=3153928 RepID=UPI00390CC2DD
MQWRWAEDTDTLEQIYRLRYRVFCLEKGWFNAEEFPSRLEQDAYDEYASHLVAQDEDGELLGCVRLVSERRCPLGLPITSHPHMAGQLPGGCAEVSRLALLPRARDGRLLRQLVQQLEQYARRQGIQRLLMLLPDRLQRRLRRCGLPLCSLGEYGYFQGQLTQPCQLLITERRQPLCPTFVQTKPTTLSQRRPHLLLIADEWAPALVAQAVAAGYRQLILLHGPDMPPLPPLAGPLQLTCLPGPFSAPLLKAALRQVDRLILALPPQHPAWRLAAGQAQRLGLPALLPLVQPDGALCYYLPEGADRQRLPNPPHPLCPPPAWMSLLAIELAIEASCRLDRGLPVPPAPACARLRLEHSWSAEPAPGSPWPAMIQPSA